MKLVDYLIIGALIIGSVIIIYRKVTGRSKTCSCEKENCGECPMKKEK